MVLTKALHSSQLDTASNMEYLESNSRFQNIARMSQEIEQLLGPRREDISHGYETFCQFFTDIFVVQMTDSCGKIL